MASYQYVAINASGKQIKGSMEANSKDKVTSSLKAEGKIPLKIEEQGLLSRDLNFHLGNPVKTKDIAVFCRQFHSIIAAGITIIRALDMLSEQTTNKVLRKAILQSKVAIEKGDTLANAMRKQDEIFPPILISMIEAAEASGSIEACFSRMAIHFEKSARLKSTLKKAMIYPTFVGIVAIAVIAIMLTTVIPSFMEMFEGMGTKMPPLTVAVINASDFMVSYWYIILIFILVFVTAIKVFASTIQGQEFFGTISLKIPLFGNIIIKSASGSYGRTMNSLMAAGITLPNAIEITAKGINNYVIKKSLLEAKKDVERGIPLSTPMETAKIFPSLVVNMTEIGEETGNLESMLSKVAEYYEEDVENATASLLAVLEPLMIIVLALIVGVILGAIFQPMLSIYSAVEGV